MAALMQSAMAISPVLAELGKSFPNASTSQVQYVYTTAYLVSVAAILLTGRLSAYINNRIFAIIGTLIICIGGTSPLFLYAQLWMLV